MALATRSDVETAPRRPRLDAIDALRGVAILGMMIFHVTWDLSFFGFIAPDAPRAPWLMNFGHAVASLFLALVGVSLALATRDGFRPGPYLWRLGAIVAAALAITVGTALLFPESYIFFGILHCIAASSVAALLFLRAPVWATLLAALAAFAAPVFVAAPALNGAWLWTGLGAATPFTNDWRPFLPWFGVTLVGLAAARAGLASGFIDALARWRATNPPMRLLALGGRHSLAVYLIHQPVLLGLLYVASQAIGPRPPDEAAYRENCATQCVAAGGGAPFCARACGCVVEAMKREGLWSKASGRVATTPAENARLLALSQTCASDP